ncbi:MAG: DinB family protein [Balneolaceae bacterium]|nr:DinB family protein [Balneolaceae bacterium]MDR9446364.1 DinB family protein [Balneolaceae bacterium]
MDQQRTHYRELFQFDLWSNRQLIKLFEREPSFDHRVACMAFVSHILTVQQIWFHKLIGDAMASELDPWAEYSVNELKLKAKNLHALWLDVIDDEESSLDMECFMSKPDGSSMQMPLWRILHHLIVHGQHHRAQVSQFLMKSGMMHSIADRPLPSDAQMTFTWNS